MTNIEAQSDRIADGAFKLMIMAVRMGLSFNEARIGFLVCARLMKMLDDNPSISDDEMVRCSERWTREELLKSESGGMIQ